MIAVIDSQPSLRVFGPSLENFFPVRHSHGFNGIQSVVLLFQPIDSAQRHAGARHQLLISFPSTDLSAWPMTLSLLAAELMLQPPQRCWRQRGQYLPSQRYPQVGGCRSRSVFRTTSNVDGFVHILDADGIYAQIFLSCRLQFRKPH